MTDKLKPCPFCGCTDIRNDHPDRAPRVYCGDCRVVSECPRSWNTRTDAIESGAIAELVSAAGKFLAAVERLEPHGVLVCPDRTQNLRTALANMGVKP